MAGNPKLIVLSAQFRGKQFELTNDLHTVGRVDERDICIKDPSVSSHHCDLIKNNGTYIVRDNNSTNGTRVNNIPITEQELQNSDIIQIGGVEVLFDNEDKSSTTTTQQKTQTNIIISADLDTNTAALRRAQSASTSSFRSSTARNQKIFYIIAGVLLFAIIGLFIVLTMFNG